MKIHMLSILKTVGLKDVLQAPNTNITNPYDCGDIVEDVRLDALEEGSDHPLSSLRKRSWVNDYASLLQSLPRLLIGSNA